MEGLPLTVGWAAAILDEIAVKIATTFYKSVAVGQSIDRALARARQAIRSEYEPRDDPSWSLPVLYAGTTQTKLFDEQATPEQGRRPTFMQQPLPGMVEGYTAHFIGRRRELQSLIPTQTGCCRPISKWRKGSRPRKGSRSVAFTEPPDFHIFLLYPPAF